MEDSPFNLRHWQLWFQLLASKNKLYALFVKSNLLDFAMYKNLSIYLTIYMYTIHILNIITIS